MSAESHNTSDPLDHTEEFPHLARTPIVEAAIQIHCRVQVAWNEATIRPLLVDRLPDYSNVQSLSAFRLHLDMQQSDSTSGEDPSGFSAAHRAQTAWGGLRMSTPDGRWVAVFTAEWTVVSRLAPYDGWQSLSDEAMRLWVMFAEIANVSEIHRVATRYINRIDVPAETFDVADYFHGFGDAPSGFVARGFLHQDTLRFPGYPYDINRIRTIRANPDTQTSHSLILDLDVASNEKTIADRSAILRKLSDFRCIKNKVFFSSVTDRTLDLFREPAP